MTSESIIIAHACFWVLAPLAIFLPIRWSILAFLVLIQFDLSATGGYQSETLGIDNALRVVLIPTILLWRVRKSISFDPVFKKLRLFWILLIGYSALALLWSGYKLSAVKMLGYFYAYSVLFVVFAIAWRKKWLDVKILLTAVWAALALGVLQSYILGNEFGALGNYYGSPDFEWRFTSFTGAQSYAAFLLAIFVLLLFCGKRNFSVVAGTVAAGIGILLTGSRSIFLGLAWILLTAGVAFAHRKNKHLALRSIVLRAAVGGLVLLIAAGVVLEALPQNRLNQMLTAVISSDNSLEDIGTFAWRFSLYEKAIDTLTNRSIPRLLIGSGTSSAADLVLETGVFTDENVDPNRAMHDEFLRSIYEWGLPGIAFLVLFLFEAVRQSIRMIKSSGTREAWAFLAIAVPMLISLTVENFLADGASPGGVGYCLVLTCMVAANSVAVTTPEFQFSFFLPQPGTNTLPETGLPSWP